MNNFGESLFCLAQVPFKPQRFNEFFPGGGGAGAEESLFSSVTRALRHIVPNIKIKTIVLLKILTKLNMSA